MLSYKWCVCFAARKVGCVKIKTFSVNMSFVINISKFLNYKFSYNL